MIDRGGRSRQIGGVRRRGKSRIKFVASGGGPGDLYDGCSLCPANITIRIRKVIKEGIEDMLIRWSTMTPLTEDVDEDSESTGISQDRGEELRRGAKKRSDSAPMVGFI